MNSSGHPTDAVENQLGGIAFFLNHGFQFPVDAVIADDGIDIDGPPDFTMLSLAEGLWDAESEPSFHNSTRSALLLLQLLLLPFLKLQY
jgi:hypothetical protein